MHYADLADFLDNAKHKLYYIIFPLIADKMSPEVITCLSDGNKQHAIQALGIKVATKVIEKLNVESAIEILDTVEPELKQSLLNRFTQKKRKQILEGFQYPENSVGRVLEKDFLSFDENWNVEQAIEFIRNHDIQSDIRAAIITVSYTHLTLPTIYSV